MKRARGLLGIGLMLLAGCSMLSGDGRREGEEQALRDLQWSFAEDGVELLVSADPGLNTYDGQAHSLLLVVAQMQQPNAFSQYTPSARRLSQLLLMEDAPPGVLGITRLFIEPGEQRRIRLPRLESARYIGLAAGYAHLDPLRSARLYRVGVGVTESGFWSSTYKASVEPLSIDLWLGADGVLRGPQSRPAPPPAERPQAGEVRLAPAR